MALMLGTICLSGCFSLEHTKIDTTGDEHVLAMNYGWKLFNCVPLVCGNATSEKDSTKMGPWAFFRDDVTNAKVQARFMEYVKSTNREVSDIHYHNQGRVFFSIPLISITIPLPYVLCYNEVQISGVLKK